MVANPALAPSSDLYCYEQWLRENARIQDTEHLELHHLYRAPDCIEAHKSAIEEALYFRLADLLRLDVDLSSTTQRRFSSRSMRRIAASPTRMWFGGVKLPAARSTAPRASAASSRTAGTTHRRS
jgi:hypothetical protein